jgi:hypothetical protein
MPRRGVSTEKYGSANSNEARSKTHHAMMATSNAQGVPLPVGVQPRRAGASRREVNERSVFHCIATAERCITVIPGAKVIDNAKRTAFLR